MNGEREQMKKRKRGKINEEKKRGGVKNEKEKNVEEKRGEGWRRRVEEKYILLYYTVPLK